VDSAGLTVASGGNSNAKQGGSTTLTGSGGIRNTSGMGGSTPTGGTVAQGGNSAQGGTSACKPQTEICNGRDDDCNQTIDNEAGCPFPVRYFEKHAYLLVPMALTWNDAAAFCRDRGYILIVLNEEKEEDWFFGQLTELRRSSEVAQMPWWLGYTDAEQEGTWVASDGSIIEYTNWLPGKPNNKDKDGLPENCGSLESPPAGPAWNDVGCTTIQTPFACESRNP
jgi:Lectin C-type domain